MNSCKLKNYSTNRRKGNSVINFVIAASALLVLTLLVAMSVNIKRERKIALEGIPTANMTSAQIAAINDQTLMAVLWTRSAEYRALCYQAYNIALERVSMAVANHRAGLDNSTKPLAMVLDCNQTILDNSGMFAGSIGTGKPTTDEVWPECLFDVGPQALAGAVNLMKAVDKLGVQIFYITNLDPSLSEPVSARMTELGFPQVDTNHVLAKGDFAQLAEKFNIIVYMGDSLGDLNLDNYEPNADSDTRVAIADAQARNFGVTRVLLPNPLYGDWEKSLAEGYSTFSLSRQDKIRRAALKK